MKLTVPWPDPPLPGDLQLMPRPPQGASQVTNTIPAAKNTFAKSLPDPACSTNFAVQAASKQ